MAEFSVGEIVIVVFIPDTPEDDPDGLSRYHNSECQIVDGLGVYDGAYDHLCYGIKFPDGTECWAEEEYLRKRRPPESYKDQFTPASKDFNWREPVKGEVVA